MARSPFSLLIVVLVAFATTNVSALLNANRVLPLPLCSSLPGGASSLAPGEVCSLAAPAKADDSKRRLKESSKAVLKDVDNFGGALSHDKRIKEKQQYVRYPEGVRPLPLCSSIPGGASNLAPGEACSLATPANEDNSRRRLQRSDESFTEVDHREVRGGQNARPKYPAGVQPLPLCSSLDGGASSLAPGEVCSLATPAKYDDPRRNLQFEAVSVVDQRENQRITYPKIVRPLPLCSSIAGGVSSLAPGEACSLDAPANAGDSRRHLKQSYNAVLKDPVDRRVKEIKRYAEGVRRSRHVPRLLEVRAI